MNTYTNPSFAATVYLSWTAAAVIANDESRHFSRWSPLVANLTDEGKIWINCYQPQDHQKYQAHPDFA